MEEGEYDPDEGEYDPEEGEYYEEGDHEEYEDYGEEGEYEGHDGEGYGEGEDEEHGEEAQDEGDDGDGERMDIFEPDEAAHEELVRKIRRDLLENLNRERKDKELQPFYLELMLHHCAITYAKHI